MNEIPIQEKDIEANYSRKEGDAGFMDPDDRSCGVCYGDKILKRNCDTFSLTRFFFGKRS